MRETSSSRTSYLRRRKTKKWLQVTMTSRMTEMTKGKTIRKRTLKKRTPKKIRMIRTKVEIMKKKRKTSKTQMKSL